MNSTSNNPGTVPTTLLQRYTTVWRHAWAHRQQWENQQRQSHEAEFLPAALALQETPVSPAPRRAMWAIITFAFLALMWSYFGHMDVVAVAQGKVVPNDRTKLIQPLETATVKAIHVSDGIRVKAGQTLIELDTTATQADTDRFYLEWQQALLLHARETAMLKGIETGKVPTLFVPKTEGLSISETLKTQAKGILQGQWGEYISKRNRIQAEQAKRQAELQSTQAQINKLTSIIPLTKQRAQDYKELVDQDFVSKHSFYETEQKRIEMESDLASLNSQLSEIRAGLLETNAQAEQLKSEATRSSLDRANEALTKANGLEQELLKANTRGDRMTLTAPVAGTVQQLAVHTVGGVVTPAQVLMAVVPEDDALEIEALIQNKDIGFIKPGQAAEVKIETFQFTKYGTIPAKVNSISVDAISHEKLGLVYSARVRMEREHVQVDGRPVSLSPGMAVTVEIKTGERRILDYFLSPLQTVTDESMRER